MNTIVRNQYAAKAALDAPIYDGRSKSAHQYIYSPYDGIVSIVVFTALALATIPLDFGPRGALFWPGVWMTVGFLFSPAISAWREPKAIVRPENVLSLIPVFWLLSDLVQSSYSLHEVTRNAVVNAFLAIATFGIALHVGRTISLRMPNLVMKTAGDRLSYQAVFALVLLAFSLGILAFAYPVNFNPLTMAQYVTAPRWAAPWTRGQFGGWDAFLDHLPYFGYLLPALTTILALKTRWSKPQVIWSVALTFIMLAFLSQGGGRRIIGTTVGVALVIWILAKPKHELGSALILIVTVGALMFWMEVMISYRLVGLGELGSANEPRIGSSSRFRVEDEGPYFRVDDNFLRLAQVIDLIPAVHPYVNEKVVLAAVVRPVPRVLWPGKPVDIGFDLPTMVGVRGASLSTSIIGELYMSAGFLAVILGGFFYGSLASAVSSILAGPVTPERALVYGISVMALFAGGRSIVDLVLMSYMLLALFGVLWLYRLVPARSRVRVQSLTSRRQERESLRKSAEQVL